MPQVRRGREPRRITTATSACISCCSSEVGSASINTLSGGARCRLLRGTGMRRREFFGVLGGAAVARAQQPERMRRIGRALSRSCGRRGSAGAAKADVSADAAATKGSQCPMGRPRLQSDYFRREVSMAPIPSRSGPSRRDARPQMMPMTTAVLRLDSTSLVSSPLTLTATASLARSATTITHIIAHASVSRAGLYRSNLSSG